MKKLKKKEVHVGHHCTSLEWFISSMTAKLVMFQYSLRHTLLV